jgi:hypothetical protein
MDLRFPVLAISEGEKFTGIWACGDETGCRQGTRSAFDAGCWDNLDLVDGSGRVHRMTGPRIEAQLPASWSQRLFPASRIVQVSFELTRSADTDLPSLKQRVIRIVDDDEEGFAEMRALYHRDDFDKWRLRLGSADSFELLIALFL